MLSKAQIKLINSLSHKKFRDELKMFIAEGEKLVGDLKPYFECVLEVTEAEDLKKVSLLSTPSSRLAVFRTSRLRSKDEGLRSEVGGLVLALDCVQDPGNMGTIIRTADWFGVHRILCSRETADVYNPKVVQATMGAIARVEVEYCDLGERLSSLLENGWAVYGTFLEGRSLYECALKREKAVVVMGNEGKGVSEKIKQLVTDKLLIPSYPAGEATSESLNVAIATGIVLSEFRRNPDF